MNPVIKEYIIEIGKQYKSGVAREHSYRPALKNLLNQLTPHSYMVINEPARIDCGAPDFIVTNNDIPVFFIECKDIADGDLDGHKQHKEQFDRYKGSLDHIVFTDYLDFHFYENQEFVESVRIAEIKGDSVVAVEDKEALFVQLIERFAKARPQKICSCLQLAKIMANKTRLLANIIERTLDGDTDGKSELFGQFDAFRRLLINDLNSKTFADIYAQTICYGMFAARLCDETPETFSRMEAADLIPKSNPFLRQVFQAIATFNLDERIAWIVDDLVETFRATNLEELMGDFGKDTQQTDPMMHFYEDFLRQYDPASKKSCGVYYTPQPVVDFIVRSVDEILKTEFNLPMGLADTAKIKVDRAVDGTYDKKSKDGKAHVFKEYHRVQVLDPATGTGTFLAQVIRQIYHNINETGMQGVWGSYVHEHLIPRLNGFELMMAPYSIAHIKLDLLLNTLGEIRTINNSAQRLRVYLTNSLEEVNPYTGTLFAQWLGEESTEANVVKRDTPVMIMIGNPPYSVSSNNSGTWITNLMNDYKKDLNERNIQPLSDDYIKFIRLGQHYVEKNGSGILAYISNNSFIDGLIHRQMRKSLLETFDKIYILDLHGNTRKKETCEDGSKDENVFDIMQGVSINIFVKSKEKHNGFAQVFHNDLYGFRQSKYEFLETHDLASMDWNLLQPQAPQYFFVPKDFSAQADYEKGFKVDELMEVNTNGIKTHNDKALVSIDKFLTTTNKCFYYRPFDNRWIDYDLSKVVRHRYSVMRNMLQPNVSLILCRQIILPTYQHVFVSTYLSDINSVSLQTKESSFVFPLYLYPDNEQPTTDGNERIPNLNKEIWHKIENIVGQVTPEQIFDYIYGVLHTPSYRVKYKEFLKVDFPRIPYPTDNIEFKRIVSIGNSLRKLHLMESVPQMSSVAQFNVAGDNRVEKVEYRNESVYINDTQCFSNIPEIAWHFYIGGYQPAQKWLKDRKGRVLTYDDILHYRRILAILLETHRLMQML